MKITVLFVLVLSVSYFAGQWLKQNELTEKESFKYHSLCDPLKNECTFNQSGNIYKLKFSGAPSSLVSFDVLLTSAYSFPERVSVSFEMDGMQMGINEFQMRYINEKAEVSAANENTRWRAEVLLPVCSLGRNDWALNVKILSNSELHITEFRFKLP